MRLYLFVFCLFCFSLVNCFKVICTVVWIQSLLFHYVSNAGQMQVKRFVGKEKKK